MATAARPALLERLAVFVAVAAFLLVVPAGMMGLLEPGETRIAEIAREICASGDWLVPRLVGLVDLREPPLAAWTAAAGMGPLGANAWGARVPVTLASLATALFTVLAARRRFGALLATPALAGWLLLGMALFEVAGRLLSPDPFVAAAAAGWWALAPSPWALALLGLGGLARGPAVLLATVLPVLLAAAWRRERAPLALLGPAWGWLLAAALALPWLVAVATRVPGSLGALLAGGLSPAAAGRGAAWTMPVALVAGALPWTPALLAGLAVTWRERDRVEARLLVLWLLAPLAACTLIGAGAASLLLPALPAAALLAALGFERGGRWVRHATGLLLLVLAGAMWIAARHYLGRLIGIEPPEAFRIPLGLWLAIAALAIAAFRVTSGPADRAAFLVAVGTTAALVSIAPYDRALGSPRGVVDVLRETRGAEPVVEVGELDAGLPFHLGERVRLLEVPVASRFDDAATRERVFVPRDSIAPLVDAHGRVWLFGPPGSASGLADSLGLRWTRIATWRGRALGFVSR